MSGIDWSKAGKRIRFSPRVHGRSPDWNFREQRWKVEAEYAGEAMTHGEVAARVACPVDSCAAIVGRFCHDVLGNRMDEAHPERVRLAGEQALAENAGGTAPGGNDDREDG